MRAQTRAALHEALVQRWTKLLELDREDDAFWETVATAFGHDDVSDLTAAEDHEAVILLKRATNWLKRLP